MPPPDLYATRAPEGSLHFLHPCLCAPKSPSSEAAPGGPFRLMIGRRCAQKSQRGFPWQHGPDLKPPSILLGVQPAAARFHALTFLSCESPSDSRDTPRKGHSTGWTTLPRMHWASHNRPDYTSQNALGLSRREPRNLVLGVISLSHRRKPLRFTPMEAPRPTRPYYNSHHASRLPSSHAG